MIQRSVNLIHSNTIQRIMNRLKIYGKLAETFHDKIQKSLNRINWLEKHFDQEK